jgi:hypothetical protein
MNLNFVVTTEHAKFAGHDQASNDKAFFGHGSHQSTAPAETYVAPTQRR